ncbi:MAG: hypothetical protein ACJAQ6_000986 [Arenicella sp.]|jgi:uncharacterized protein
MDIKVQQRIISLDLLRGIAVFGILWMNIQSFSAPLAAYSNPTAYGDFSGANFWAWAIANVFVEFKFMTLFSILFGAGIAIFYRRASEKGFDARALNTRRMQWLLVFGLIHGYFIWYGDILFVYAVCGLIAVRFVETSTKRVLISASVMLAVPVLFIFLLSLLIAAGDAQLIIELTQEWAPPEALLQSEIYAYKSSWLDTRLASFPTAITFQFVGLVIYGWRALAGMLIGIVLLRIGFITASMPLSRYRAVALIALPIGLSVSAWGVIQNVAHHFSMEFSIGLGTLFNYFGSLATSLGYIALVMLLCKSRALLSFKSALANVGKMAFTNYIMQSLICTFIFYGYGLNYFAELSRVECLAIVIMVWLIQLCYSTFWLSHFKQGPLEKFWRYLTYRQLKTSTTT